MPIIVHIDMNSFFASCEVRRNPFLKGKEIIISGKTNRSIVSAASYEAKKREFIRQCPIIKPNNFVQMLIFLWEIMLIIPPSVMRFLTF